MFELHTFGLEEMKNVVAGLKEHECTYKQFPLVMWAKDAETLRFLFRKGYNVDTFEWQRRGLESVIEYAARTLDADMVSFLTNFEIKDEEAKAAILAAVSSAFNSGVDPMGIVNQLYRSRMRGDDYMIKELSKSRSNAIAKTDMNHDAAACIRIEEIAKAVNSLFNPNTE